MVVMKRQLSSATGRNPSERADNWAATGALWPDDEVSAADVDEDNVDESAEAVHKLAQLICGNASLVEGGGNRPIALLAESGTGSFMFSTSHVARRTRARWAVPTFLFTISCISCTFTTDTRRIKHNEHA